jgi:hypothetical protein
MVRSSYHADQQSEQVLAAGAPSAAGIVNR